MRFLIKFLFIIVLVILVLYGGLLFYGKPLLCGFAAKYLHTEITIESVKLFPAAGAFKLKRIKIPDWHSGFLHGVVYLFPPRLVLRGLCLNGGQRIILNNVFLEVNIKNMSKDSPRFTGYLRFDGVDLRKIIAFWPELAEYGFAGGCLNGDIAGAGSPAEFSMNGLLCFSDLVFNEAPAVALTGPLGLSLEDIIDYAEKNNRLVNIDFMYKGPLADLNNPFRYRPGPRIIRSLGGYLFRKITNS